MAFRFGTRRQVRFATGFFAVVGLLTVVGGFFSSVSGNSRRRVRRGLGTKETTDATIIVDDQA